MSVLSHKHEKNIEKTSLQFRVDYRSQVPQEVKQLIYIRGNHLFKLTSAFWMRSVVWTIPTLRDTGWPKEKSQSDNNTI